MASSIFCHSPTNPNSIFCHSPTNPNLIFCHNPTNPNSIFCHNPTNPKSIFSHNSTNPNSIFCHKPTNYNSILYHYPTNPNPHPRKECCPPLIVGDLPHLCFRELCHTLALESCVRGWVWGEGVVGGLHNLRAVLSRGFGIFLSTIFKVKLCIVNIIHIWSPDPSIDNIYFNNQTFSYILGFLRQNCTVTVSFTDMEGGDRLSEEKRQ